VSVESSRPVFPENPRGHAAAGPGGTPSPWGGRTPCRSCGGAHPNAPRWGWRFHGATGTPPALAAAIGPFRRDPVAMARKCAGDWGARFLFLSLAGCHPRRGGAERHLGAAVVRECALLHAPPVIVGGCGDEEVDARLFPPRGGGRTAGLPLVRGGEESPARRGRGACSTATAWSPGPPIDITCQADGPPPRRPRIPPPIASSSTR